MVILKNVAKYTLYIYKKTMFPLFLITLSTQMLYSVLKTNFAYQGLKEDNMSNVSLYSGAFAYNYPIELPEGKMKPNIVLTYNSQNGNEWLGLGWSMSTIAIYRDTSGGIPRYNDDTDIFVLNFDGNVQQLVEISSENGIKEYITKIESNFLKIVYNSNTNVQNWEIKDKSGAKYQFVKLVNCTFDTNQKCFYWGIKKIINNNGFNCTYIYENEPMMTGETVITQLDAQSTGSNGIGSIIYYPTEIQYGGNDDLNLASKYTMSFTYVQRQELLSNCRAGFKQSISKCLIGIETKINNNLINKYVINYYDANYSMIHSIIKYGNDDVTHLQGTKFYYYENSINFNVLNTDCPGFGSDPDEKYFRTGDFNGDGLTDVCMYYAPTTSIYVRETNGNSNFNFEQWAQIRVATYKTFLVGDFNGDGKSDVCFYNSDNPSQGTYVGLSNGSNGFEFTQWCANQSGNAPYYSLRVGDFNGDGKSDLCFYYNNETWVGLSNGINEFTFAVWCNNQSGDAPYDTLRVGDFNGDGKSDLCFYYDGHTWVGLSDAAEEKFIFTNWSSASFDSNISKTFDLGDFNGDGLSDIFFNNPANGHNYIGINVGNSISYKDEGYYFFTSWLSFDCSGIGDFNGDGFSDVVFYKDFFVFDEHNKIYDIFYSNGEDLYKGSGYISDVYGDDNYKIGDFNGDGKSDLCYYTGFSTNKIGYLTSYNYHKYSLGKIQNDFGGITDIAYKVYNEGDASILPFPVDVVTNITTHDGMGNVTTSSYTYANGLFDKDPWDKKEFLGFGKVTTKDAEGNYTETEFYQDYGSSSWNDVNVFKGKIKSQKSFNSAHTQLTSTDYAYDCVRPFTGINVYFPKLARVDSTVDSKTTMAAYLYDNNTGNLWHETYYGEVNAQRADIDTTDNKIVITDFYEDSSDAYLLSYPTRKRILQNGNLASETWYYYDHSEDDDGWEDQVLTNGMVTAVENRLGGDVGNADNPKTTMNYDVYGNVTEQKDARENKTADSGNVTTKSYDTVYHNFVVSQTNPIIGTESFTYNPNFPGQVETHTDINGQVTTYEYDEFGRLTKVIRPNDTSTDPTTKYEYVINSAPPHKTITKQRITSGQSATLGTTTYLDGFGRTIETVTPAPGTSPTKHIVSGVVTYNSRGMVEKSYLPYTINNWDNNYIDHTQYSGLFTKTEYDALGRVIKQTNPDSTYTTKSYDDDNWKETVTDEKGNTKDYYKDAFGRIKQIDEHNTVNSQNETYHTYYTYDVLNNLKTITKDNDDVTEINYDLLGRKINMSDPQMGYWSYTYDLNGNLKTQTDPKSQEIEMNYDRLNRITAKIYPDDSSLNYDYDQNNLFGDQDTDYSNGKLVRVYHHVGGASTDWLIHYKYDNLGREIKRKRSFGALGAYADRITETSYDALGRETSLKYPDNETITNTYDKGALTSVSGSGLNFDLTYDDAAVGKLKRIVYGTDRVITDYTYKADNLRLDTIKTYGPYSNPIPIQDFAYTYDYCGNITVISDKDTATNHCQTFGYDNLNRLVYERGKFYTGQDSYGEKHYEYDSVGNITKTPDKTKTTWDCETTDNFTFNGTVSLTDSGRYGKGLQFSGVSSAELNNTSEQVPWDALTIELWAKSDVLGSGCLVNKTGSYGFASVNTDGSLSSTLTLDGTVNTLNTSANVIKAGVWHHLALTYNGTTIKVYVDAVEKVSQIASGHAISRNPAYNVSIGNNFTGKIDELKFHNTALSLTELQARVAAVPNTAPNKPYTPKYSAHSTPMDFYGGKNINYTFKFKAFDTNNDNLVYTIYWGDLSADTVTGSLSNGTEYEGTHSWANEGVYWLKMKATDSHNAQTDWSEILVINICNQSQANIYGNTTLCGYSTELSQVSVNGSTISASAIGEPVVGISIGATNNKCYFGYQGGICGNNQLWSGYSDDYEPGNDEPVLNKISIPSLIADYTQEDTTELAEALKAYEGTTYKDANGNSILANGRRIFYDYDNRIKAIVTTDGSLTEYVYDHEGQRIKKQTNSGNYELYYGTLFDELYSSGGSLLKQTKYIHAGNQRVAMKDSSGNAYYIHADHLGSTHLMTNAATGAVVRTNKYLPYGGTFETSGTADDTHKYTGQVLDDNTGLYYYNARYYDPQLCTFITPDTKLPLKVNMTDNEEDKTDNEYLYDPQLLNRFAYCRNNPIKHIDPSGERITIYERNVAFGQQHLFAVVQHPGSQYYNIHSLTSINGFTGGRAVYLQNYSADVKSFENNWGRDLRSQVLSVPEGKTELQHDIDFMIALKAITPVFEGRYPDALTTLYGVMGGTNFLGFPLRGINSNTFIDVAAELSGSPLRNFGNTPIQEKRLFDVNFSQIYLNRYNDLNMNFSRNYDSFKPPESRLNLFDSYNPFGD